MRRTIRITALALLFALAICALANRFIHGVTERARHLRTEAIEAMETDDVQRAEQTLVELASLLRERKLWLELLCEHDALHDMKAQLIDAQASIEFGIVDDFYQAIYRFGEALEHLAEIEGLSLSNLC